uniref:Uncharacterized protein n=1 Tax=Mola mola TaxID=94237 RepID=A0A3Q3WC90_MOLML
VYTYGFTSYSKKFSMMPYDKNVRKLANLTVSDKITMETKGSDHKPNEWLDWLVFTAQSRKLANCFICAAVKPSLATAPLANQSHTDCILSQMNKTGPNPSCNEMLKIYPRADKSVPRGVLLYPGNYTCGRFTVCLKRLTSLKYLVRQGDRSQNKQAIK